MPLMSEAEFDAKIGNDQVGSAFLKQRVTYQTYAGDPTNNLAPEHQYGFCIDTSNAALYWASTAASSGWKKLTP
jgi:hypothetical protein